MMKRAGQAQAGRAKAGLRISGFALYASTAMMIAGAAATPALAQAPAAISYSVPAGPLGMAISRFGDHSNIQVLYSADLVRGKRSAGVSGQHTRESALDRLLSGTGLLWRYTNANTITIIDPASAGATQSGSAAGSVVLDTITVAGQGATTEGTGRYTGGESSTATRLALSVRETPQSMTVLTNQRIRDQALNTAADALSATTGVSVNQGDNVRSLFYSRGFLLYNTVVDGVSYNIDNTWGEQFNSMAMYDRVEVVRGATGLQSTAGDPSGSVQLVRKRATSDVLTGSADFTYGRWNNYNPAIDISTPLNSDASVRARFVGEFTDRDSYMDRLHNERQLYYGTVEADLTDQTTAIFGLDYTNRRSPGATFGAVPAIFTNGNPTNLPRSFSSAPEWAYYNTEALNAFGRMEHEFDNGWKGETSLQFLQRERHSEQVYFINGGLNQATGLGLSPLFDKEDGATRQWTWNASVGGDVTLFEREHQLNFGISAARRESKRYYYTGTAAAPIGSLYDWDGSYAYPARWNLGTNYDWRGDSTILSGFASGRFSLTDDAHLILGGRFNDWKGDVRHFQNFTPYAGVTYDLDDTYTLYASYAELFNPQNVRDQAGQYLDPKVGKSYEAGIKAEYLGGLVNASLSVFRTEQDNVAEMITNGFVLGTSERAYRAVSGISTRGVELDVSGEVADGWQLGLGGSIAQTQDRNGNDFQGHLSDRTFKLYTTYQLPGAWDKLTIGGGVRWQSGTYANVITGGNTYRIEQGSLAIFDVMARYDFTETLSAQLNVTNLFDRTYFGAMQSQVQYGEPLNATLKISAKF